MGREAALVGSIDPTTREEMTMADRDQLLRDEDLAWSTFVAEIGRVPEHVRAEVGVVPGWSVNDLVYHCGRWAAVGADKLDQLRRGEQVTEDDDGEASNQMWAAESKSMTYQEAMARALAERERARRALEAFDTVDHEAALWFSEETTDHYAEHAQEIARFADSLGPGDAGFRGRPSGSPESAT